MNKQDLQKQISEFYSKLPKRMQGEFSSMEWMNTLQKIALKYKLNSTQSETLGIETSLVLLGIIHIEEFASNLERELRLDLNILNNLLHEINTEIIKDFEQELTEVFTKNAEDLEKENPNTNTNNNDDIPLPPYAKKDSSTHSEPLPPQGLPVMDGGVKTEEELFEKTGIKMMDENKKESLEENKFTNSEDKILFDSGIKTIEEGHTIDKGNSLSNINMESISNQINIPIPPEARTNMINQRLNENVVNTQSAVTHSSDLLTKDPYHETID